METRDFTKRWWVWLGILAFVFASPVNAQPDPLYRAHAHNDYEQDRPLQDALDHGFTSIEADIHLVDGSLLVAHDLEDVQPGLTLQALYLDPLRERIRQNEGHVYATGPSLILLIDIKSEALETYTVLHRVLRQYADILTIYAGETIEEGPVTAIISGNRPRATMAVQPIRYAAYDGRLEDLEVEASSAFIPLISDNWFTYSRWLGRGAPPDDLVARLTATVDQAHAQGRKVRFWATSENPAVWQVLYDAGVDYLNADNLTALQEFLIAQDQRPNGSQ